MTWTVIVDTTAHTLYVKCPGAYVADRLLTSIGVAMGERLGGFWLYPEYDADVNDIGKATVVNPSHIVKATVVEGSS